MAILRSSRRAARRLCGTASTPPAVRPLSHLTTTPECRGPGGRLRFAARANIAERLNGYREKLVEKGQDPVSFRCTMV